MQTCAFGAPDRSSGARPISDAARIIERRLLRQPHRSTSAVVDRAGILRALEAAARPIGLSDGEFATLRVLILATRDTDWQPGAVPMAWPSNQHLASVAGKSIGTIKNRIRRYRLLGLLRMHDSANGKRRGSRSVSGSIVEAYGFDLSPLQERYDEFLTVGARHRLETNRFKVGQRQLNADARLIRQVVAQAAELALMGDHWPALVTDLDHQIRSAYEARRRHDMAAFEAAIGAIEALRRSALERLDTLILKLEIDPMGSESCPPIQLHTDPPWKNVQAAEDSKASECLQTEHQQGRIGGTSRQRPIRISPGELAAIFPAAAAYVGGGRADWDDTCRGAARLGHDLGVRRGTYVDAVRLLGREGAALALFITAERKARGQIRTTPGSYFAGMTERARSGRLDLTRSLWAFATTPPQAACSLQPISSRLAADGRPTAFLSRADRRA